jgi:hypothetical protein
VSSFSTGHPDQKFEPHQTLIRSSGAAKRRIVRNSRHGR